jgi:hypothetical protein
LQEIFRGGGISCKGDMPEVKSELGWSVRVTVSQGMDGGHSKGRLQISTMGNKVWRCKAELERNDWKSRIFLEGVGDYWWGPCVCVMRRG